MCKYLVFLLLSCLLSFTQVNAFSIDTNIPLEVYFSPGDHVTDKIIDKIQNSKTSIYILSYSFTSKPIATALIGAFKRGVRVELIIDGGQTDYNRTWADDCQRAGIPVYLDTKYKIAHDKVMIFDNQIVLTGSFNFTQAANNGNNSENVVFIHNPEIAQLYKQRWDLRLKTTTPYE